MLAPLPVVPRGFFAGGGLRPSKQPAQTLLRSIMGCFHLNSSATPPWGSRSLIWGVLSRDGGLECPQLRGAVMGRLGVGRLLFLMFLLHVPRE
jgi:hypothetical protein